MKRFYAVLFVLLFVLSCGGHHAPIPPQPPPQLCGNGVCDASETHATCPADCPAPPPVPSCGDGACNGTETCTSCPKDCGDCPPPPPPPDRVKDHTRWISFGMYAIIGQGIDYDRVFEALYHSGFNAISLHISSPWMNKAGRYFVKYKGGGPGSAYDLKTQDDAYYRELDEIFDAAGRWGISLEICFVDAYGDEKWSRYPGYPFKPHPYRNNIQHETLDARSLYINWKKQDVTKPSSFYWMQWKADAHDHVLVAKPTSAIGAALMTYISTVAEHAWTAKKKHPALVFWVRYANEPFSHCADHYQCDPTDDFGIDPRVEDWIEQQFTKLGFVYGKDVVGVKNDQVFQPGTFNYNLDDIFHNFLWCEANGRVLELHGVHYTAEKIESGLIDNGTVKQIVGYFSAHDPHFKGKYLLLSSDGVKDAVVNDEDRKREQSEKEVSVDYKGSDNFAKGATATDKVVNMINAASRRIFQ